MIISTKIVYISPDVAREYLAKNFDGNRNIRKTWVKTLADMMAAGVFNSLNGQNRIIFGTDGKMYDGQHRMHAIIASGVTLPFEVCISNTAQSDYATFDYAQVKRTSDFAGTHNSCAIATRMLAIEHGVAPLLTAIQGRINTSTPASRVDITHYINANKDNVDRITAIAMKMRNTLNCGQIIVYGTFIFVLEYVHDDLFIDSFVEDLACPYTDNKTIITLKQLIMRSYLSKKRPTASWLLGVLLQAYVNYKVGNSVTCLNKPMQYTERYSKMMQQERQERRKEYVA